MKKSVKPGNRRTRLLFVLAYAGLLAPAAPCEQRRDAVNFDQWFDYTGDHPVSGRFGVHLETQLRRTRHTTEWRQLLFRPALNIELGRGWSAAFGYAHSRVYRYGGVQDRAVTPEHRAFEQVDFKRRAGHFKLTNRFRVEQRFLASAPSVPNVPTGWRYVNRFRYTFQVQRPLTEKSYVKFYSETHARFGIHYHGRVFDQQRTYCSVGRELAPHWWLEAGYLYQFCVPRTGRLYEHHHIVQLSILSNASFRRRDR